MLKKLCLCDNVYVCVHVCVCLRACMCVLYVCVRMYMHIMLSLSTEPYTLSEARIHVCRVRELLTDNIDLLTSGSDGLILVSHHHN